MLLAGIMAAAQDTLTVTLTGDLLLDRGVRKKIERDGVDALFNSGIDSVFASSHIVIANLECPATRIHAPVQKIFIFRGEPEWLAPLRRHGITHLNLANNHSIDQGRKGLIDTQDNIRRAGITPIGAGRNMQEAAQPVLLATQPRPVYIIASNRLTLENYAYLPQLPCVSQENMDSLLLRVASLRRSQPSAYIIVSLHWGIEHTLSPYHGQRKVAHDIIDAGADILVCHHTHTFQTVETYQNKPIYYSLGNFIFDQSKPLNARAAIVQLQITATAATARTLPIVIRDCVPMLSETQPQTD